MLTRDLLRCKVRDGVVEPTLLKPTPAVVDLAERVIAHWTQAIGQRRGDLEDAALPVLHRSRALLVGRGFQKLVLDRCRFADPASSEALRGRALAASAELLAAPVASGDDHRGAVAARLGIDATTLGDRLYGDLPDQAVLEAVEAVTARALIERYNLALCQGLLIHARELRVTLHDRDPGTRRKLLKALRFRRLLADVASSADGQAIDLVISGPAAVLDQATRYGLQLALFLPALACARRWQATASIALPRGPHGGGEATLTLSDATGLTGDSVFLGFVPDELRDLHTTLGAKFPDWRLDEPGLLPMPDGELVVPDLLIRVAGAAVPVELFHRWHGHALARRLDQVAAGHAPRLVIGVDRALAKTTGVAPLVASPTFARHGFLFSDLPVPRVLREAVERVCGPA